MPARRELHKLSKVDVEYVPASIEKYVTDNLESLGYDRDETNPPLPKGCAIWNAPEASTQENFDNMVAYLADIGEYSKAIEGFTTNVPDLMDVMRERKMGNLDHDISDICKGLRPHPHGINALFPSKQLSLSKAGFVEPLTTPMRHPSFCESPVHSNLFRIDYLVHDFEKMCLDLKPTSRRVLIDMGASLQFHGDVQPMVTLMETYAKFGFNFDHIYAIDITPTEPTKMYEELLPKKYFASYHWINTGEFNFILFDLSHASHKLSGKQVSILLEIIK